MSNTFLHGAKYFPGRISPHCAPLVTGLVQCIQDMNHAGSDDDF